MNSIKELTILIFLYLSINFDSSQCDKVETQVCPRLFSDHLISNSIQSVTAQNIPQLGRVKKLRTLTGPVKNISILIDVYTRQKDAFKIEFSPKRLKVKSQCKPLYQYDIGSLANSGFNASRRTIVMIPGFRSGDSVIWMEEAKDLWLKLEDLNVILVRFKGISKYWYDGAVASTPIIARQITILFHYLAELSGTNLNDKNFFEKFHLIGHSLGSHVAGFVGYDLAGRLGRITGLDPAGPWFDKAPVDQRLNYNAAKLVDVFHTNKGEMKYLNLFCSAPVEIISRILKRFGHLEDTIKKLECSARSNGDTAWFGIESDIGHLNYYANDGRTQPGCQGLIHECDHSRATELFIDSLFYEISSRKSDHSVSGKRRRLIAFRATDYQNFSSAVGFDSNCSELINENNFRPDENKMDCENDCTIPIDFITEVNQLKEELESKFKVNFSIENEEKPKFFFQTRDARPLMGDHYLLKVLLGNRLVWNDKCALVARISMSDDSNITIKLNGQFLSGNLNSIEFKGFALPFVHPNGDQVNQLWQNRLHESVLNYQRPSQINSIRRALRKTLPAQVDLSIVKSDHKGLIDALNPINMMWNESSIEDCELEIHLIGVTPFWPGRGTVYGLYGVRTDQKIGNVSYPTTFRYLSFRNYSTIVQDRKLLTAKDKLSIRLNELLIG